jgi:hypothetical protein
MCHDLSRTPARFAQSRRYGPGTRTQRPSWQAAAFFMHGSAKHVTVPVHVGAGSVAARTRHTHGVSAQYDATVRQSPSPVHARVIEACASGSSERGRGACGEVQATSVAAHARTRIRGAELHEKATSRLEAAFPSTATALGWVIVSMSDPLSGNVRGIGRCEFTQLLPSSQTARRMLMPHRPTCNYLSP